VSVKATHLRCEYREDPLGVDTSTPRLSWWIESDDPAAKDVEQSAYQIVVSSDEKPIWDSGRVGSSQTIQIPYAGRPLMSAQRVTWKVRFWDQDSRRSDWSDEATWTMGLLSPRDWRAKWVSAPPVEGSTRMPIFRASFRLDGPVSRAIVFFCGLGQHELQVNGKVVGEDIIDPGWTNYRKTCLYTTHDVTPLVKQGDNTIAMLLGNGMYNVVGGRYTKFKGSFGDPKLIFQMHMDFADGSSTIVTSDESWQTAPGPITFSCIYGGEDYDARLEDGTIIPFSPGGYAGSNAPSPNDPARPRGLNGEWRLVDVVDGPGGVLRAQSQPPIRVMQTFKTIKTTEPKPGVKIYDLGQNMSGRPRITIKANAGATVTLKSGELLNPDGTVSQKHIGSPVSFSYTCRSSETETWNPRFSYHGFRYVQAEGAELADIEGQFTHSSAAIVGSFECSDPMLNRIHTLIDKAILSNMQSILTDCPHREKLGWLEQSHLMAPAIFFNYDVPLLYDKISRDMREAQQRDGCVPTIAPQYTQFGPKYAVFDDSPEWGSAAVINPWLMFRLFGDRRILEDNYASMKAYVEYLHRRENEGIVAYGLGDWYDIGPKPPGVSQLTSLGVTGTAIFYCDTIILQHVAEILGQDADADRYKGQADRILGAFNDKFFDDSKKQYDRNSQTASAMALALDLVDEENRDVVLSNLIRDIRDQTDHITAGDIGFLYVIRALGDADRSDVIYDLLKRTDPPSYGSQLARGATTLTEAWDADRNSSQNHLMLGHAEIWFYEYLAGIRIDLSKDAPEQIVVRPAYVDGVDWVKASYESMLGPIQVSWRRDGGKVKLNVAIPANASASVYLRDQADPQQVGSGSYEFDSTVAT
jgi:hypothetical protein